MTANGPDVAASSSSAPSGLAERQPGVGNGDKPAMAHLMVFSLAAFALLWVARAGAAGAVVQSFLLVFVALATLWVRTQYVDGLDGRQWVIPGNWAVALLAGSLGLVAWWRGTGADGFLLGALYLLWLGGSAIVTRMRDVDARRNDGVLKDLFTWTSQRRGRMGAGLSLGGLLMLVAGILLLGRSKDTLIVSGVLIGTAFVLMLPIGISLLSEAALQTLEVRERAFVRPQGGWLGSVWAWAEGRLATSRREQLLRGWARFVDGAQPLPLVLVGGTGFVALAGAAVLLSQTWLALMVFGALLVLIIALVSSTHADVAIVMAAVALLGVTPHQQELPADPARPASGQLSTLVALGDSYMSGEGASVYYDGTDEGGGNQCRRAPTAWAALAASGFDALDFLACSGARSGNVLYDPTSSSPEVQIPSDSGARRFRDALVERAVIGPQKGGDRSNQLDTWRRDQKSRGLKASLVVVSLGGNDVGFSTIGQMCLAPGSCSDRASLWTGALDQVRAQLRLAYLEIAETFPDVPVVTVAYPDPISLEQDRCNQVSLTLLERHFIHDFLTGKHGQVGLNDVIRETSDEFGFHHVASMEAALSDVNLQLCDELNDGRPGLNFIGLRSVRGAAEQRFNPGNWLHSSLHPNERGHAALLRTFETWQASQPILRSRRAVPPEAARRWQDALKGWSGDPQAQASATVQKAGQCDLFDTSQNGCRPQGATWALAQVRHALLGGALWLALAAAAASWIAAVGFFASRRRRWAESDRRRGGWDR